MIQEVIEHATKGRIACRICVLSIMDKGDAPIQRARPKKTVIAILVRPTHEEWLVLIHSPNKLTIFFPFLQITTV